MEIIFTVLGSGSAVQFQNRASSSYLLEFENKKIVLDAGFWLLDRLEKISVKADQIDYIFISHKHPDHFIGLIHLLFALKNPFYKRKKPLFLLGFKGLKKYFNEFENILGKWIKPNIELIFIEKDKYQFPGFSYTLFKSKHSKESVGITLFIGDKKIVYTSDTEYFDSIERIANNSDLAVFECASSFKHKIRGHLSIEDILKINRKTNIQNIILSHFYPDSLPKQKIPPNFLIANDLLSVKIN